MVDRVYFIMDVFNGDLDKTIHRLRNQPGIVLVDALEERPAVIAVAEAKDRKRLARVTVNALASVENMTANLSLMPTNQVQRKDVSCKPSNWGGGRELWT